MGLPSTKPYLLRAIHQWCSDNGFTPHLAVAVDADVRVPREHVRDGQIVLNVDYEATANLVFGNELITFQARFSGVAREVSIPVVSVIAIYARENGAGMAFEPETEAKDEPAVGRDSSPDDEPPGPPDGLPPAGRPRLQRVK